MDTWLSDTLTKERNESKLEGKLETLYTLIKDGILTLKEAAKRMGMTVANFKRESAKYGFEL